LLSEKNRERLRRKKTILRLPTTCCEKEAVNPFKTEDGRFGRVAFALLFLGIVLAGCSVATKQKWLPVFFDGVPVPGAKTTNAIVETETAPTNAVLATAAPAAPLIVKETIHLPYFNNECAECHESKFSQKMKGPMKTVCFSCHDDFLAKPKVKHQPVDNGECGTCHNPHSSPNKFLLTRTGAAVCLDCHDNPAAAGKVKHQPVENGECIECHSPHASDFKGLMRKSTADSCFGCHDDFRAKQTFKHDPAGNGACLECHSPHASASKGLTKSAEPAVCFECHEQADMAKVAGHKVSGITTCLACHDPHGGTDKYFLRGAAKPAPIPPAPAAKPPPAK